MYKEHNNIRIHIFMYTFMLICVLEKKQVQRKNINDDVTIYRHMN